MSACLHNWHRTNGATTEDGADTFCCLNCGATGKSYGLGGLIIEDSKRSRSKKRRYWSQTYEARKERAERMKSREHLLKHGSGLKWSMKQYKKRLRDQAKQKGESK